MASPKPNYVTTCYEGKQGVKEFVFACRGRPFSVLTAPQFPTPAFTMVDHNLIRELKLRMTDLQCLKLSYGGHKLRILGKVSTSVQCIQDGVPAGNTHFKAHVIQDLYQIFDTHSIAGVKLSDKLIGPPFTITPDKPTEPTLEPITRTKKKKRPKPPSLSKLKSPPSSSCSEALLLPTPPRSKYQGQWIQHHGYQGDDDVSRTSSPPPCIQRKWIHERHYHGWDPVHEFKFTGQLKHSWYNKWTDETKYERPESFRSDASEFSYCDDDIAPHESDEYDDIYTNISTIKEAPECDPDHHGPDQCHGDCPWLGEENLPPDCGYHPRWGFITNCSASCPGHWCAHTRDSRGAEEREGREAGVGGR